MKDPGIWIDENGDERYFCLECMAWHRVPKDLQVPDWDDSKLIAYDERKRARREKANEPLIELETLLLDAELQEFFLSSEAVRMEVEAERSRAA